MDKGMDRIAEDVKDIVETRTAIADKLEKLEQCFSSSVEEAKMIAENLVDRTQSVIDDTIKSVKEATDPTHLVTQHPWLMVSGSIMVGAALGRVFSEERQGVVPYYPPGSQAASVMPASGSESTTKDGVYPFYPHGSSEEGPRVKAADSSAAPSLFTYLGPVIAEGLSQVKGDLLEVGKSVLRAWIKQAVQSGTRSHQANHAPLHKHEEHEGRR